ncbi:SpaA isopeptide-forming pilin-related protein [Streptomyces sp. NPDC048484]|uniref:SpaA isopeptide-forming pilin-related protein n=1 Tax=Streptomyces sp. NPDC048484 TaxID=3155146 RepID=UPI00343872CE
MKKDPGGDVLDGASFTLFDSAGKEAANGKTDAQGQLAFKDLTPGATASRTSPAAARCMTSPPTRTSSSHPAPTPL